MNASLLESVLRRVAPLAAEGRATDAELLRQFATRRDEAAFAALMQRHGPMVWSVCRNLLPIEADAEDAFQATFIALIRSAAKIRTPGSLGSWLYGVAYRVAQKAKRSALRRLRHEQSAASGESNSPVAAHTWMQLQSAVHDEVNRLPESLRAAFVICELEGVGQLEAAQALGVKLGTLSARLTKARQRLIERLSKNGVSAGLAVAGSLVGGSATAMAPPRLVAKVLSLAQSGGNWNDIVSATILQLARGANEVTMTRTKILAAAIALAVTLMAGTATILVPLATAQFPAQNKPGAPPHEGQTDASSQYQNLVAATQTASQWEYKFVPQKSESLEAFEKILTDAGAEGWEYCGIERLLSSKQRPEVQHPSIIFKRPKKSPRFERVVPGAANATAPRNDPAAGSSNSIAPFVGLAPTGGPPQGQSEEINIIRLQNANAKDVANILTDLLAGHCKILVDSRTNSLAVQADKDRISLILAAIEKMDAPRAKPEKEPVNPKKP